MKKLLPLLTGALFVSSAAHATDLLDVYRDALAYDARYASARAERDAGLEKRTQGRAGLKPQINFMADTKYNDNSTQLRTSPAISLRPSLGKPLANAVGAMIPTNNSSRYNTHSWGVSLVQPLFRWQNWSIYKQAELATAAAETQYSAAKQDLIERVIQAYLDALQAQEDVATAQAQKTAINEQLEAAKRSFEVGTTTITDTHEAQARFDLVTAAELAAKNDLEIKRQTLNMLTGKEITELKNLKAQVELTPPQPENLAEWIASAEKDNYNVQLSKSNLEIANREIEKNRVGHYPTVDFIASHGRQSSGTSPMGSGWGGMDTDATTVGVQLNIPIFSGGLTASKTREAVALREKASADLENVRRMAALGTRQAYLGVTSGLAQVKALEQALQSSQSALDSNKLGYEVGVRVNIDVLNAQQQYASTRRDLSKARLQTLTAQVKLKAATGTLDEQDVAVLNGLLE